MEDHRKYRDVGDVRRTLHARTNTAASRIQDDTEEIQAGMHNLEIGSDENARPDSPPPPYEEIQDSSRPMFSNALSEEEWDTQTLREAHPTEHRNGQGGSENRRRVGGERQSVGYRTSRTSTGHVYERQQVDDTDHERKYRPREARAIQRVERRDRSVSCGSEFAERHQDTLVGCHDCDFFGTLEVYCRKHRYSDHQPYTIHQATNEPRRRTDNESRPASYNDVHYAKRDSEQDMRKEGHRYSRYKANRPSHHENRNKKHRSSRNEKHRSSRNEEHRSSRDDKTRYSWSEEHRSSRNEDRSFHDEKRQSSRKEKHQSIRAEKRRSSYEDDQPPHDEKHRSTPYEEYPPSRDGNRNEQHRSCRDKAYHSSRNDEKRSSRHKQRQSSYNEEYRPSRIEEYRPSRNEGNRYSRYEEHRSSREDIDQYSRHDGRRSSQIQEDRPSRNEGHRSSRNRDSFARHEEFLLSEEEDLNRALVLRSSRDEARRSVHRSSRELSRYDAYSPADYDSRPRRNRSRSSSQSDRHGFVFVAAVSWGPKKYDSTLEKLGRKVMKKILESVQKPSTSRRHDRSH